MTVPDFMTDFDIEEATQQQLDWLKEKAEELKAYYYQLHPTLHEAWCVMSDIQSVVDPNQEWAEEIQMNELSTAYVYCYWSGTLQMLRDAMSIEEYERLEKDAGI